MIEIRKVESIENILNKREFYIKSLPFAQEKYIENMVQKCEFYLIEVESKAQGYFCVNKDKVLYELHLDDELHVTAQDIFKSLLNDGYFKTVECKTFDYLLMSLCLDYHKKASCSGYLFREFFDVTNALKGFNNICFRLANLEDTKKISEISGDFFETLEEQILKKEIFVLYSNDIILGAGVAQEVFPGMNYYDIGMIVDEKYRNKGIGTFIITKLREYCCSNNIVPICGCWYYNHSSKRTLEKAGFITKHRIITFEF